MSIRKWALWRRVQYATGFFAMCGMFGVLIYFANFYQPANCNDRLQNGLETGIDCGGGCVQICAADIIPPRIVWAESFEISPGKYNAVAYVENYNQTEGTPELSYTLQLFSGEELVAERVGKTVLPPNSAYPIFEGRVEVDVEKPVTSTNLILEPAELWLPASADRGHFRSADINLKGADTNPQLSVKIENTTLNASNNIEVVATIFNEAGEAVTASQTYIERIEGQSTKDIVFTWPNPIAKTVKNCVIPTDVALAIDLSGSMNNDGNDPPEPITTALKAASSFAGSLKENDQISLITFDSLSELVSPLTVARSSVVTDILGLEIKPTEETGFTNTSAALLSAQAELNSERHNADARRVLVLLTDGLPTASGNQDIVIETETTAKLLDDSGIEVYAIGLGQGVDQQFIRNIASSISNSYFAPTGEDLDKIYEEITSSLCEFGPTKIEIIAKPTINFAPIR